MSSDAGALLGACPMPIAESDRMLLGHGIGGRLTAELDRAA